MAWLDSMVRVQLGAGEEYITKAGNYIRQFKPLGGEAYVKAEVVNGADYTSSPYIAYSSDTVGSLLFPGESEVLLCSKIKCISGRLQVFISKDAI